MFLKYTNTHQLYVIIWSHQDRAHFFQCPHFILDLPPRQLTDQELHQHVEERPQVIVTSHLLQNENNSELTGFDNVWLSKKKRRGRRMQDSITDETKPLSHTWQILTLFLCALTDAYRTVPLNPATGRGWQIKTGIVIKWWCWWYLTCLWLVSNKIFRHKLLICFLLQTEIWRTR